MHRREILETALSFTLDDRNKTYGSPAENMQALALLWTAFLHSRNLLLSSQMLTAEDCALMMAVSKLARLNNSDLPFHADNYIDAAAYFAMAGEISERKNANA